MNMQHEHTSHDSTNHDSHFIDKNYSIPSIVLAVRQSVFHGGKNNGVVCAHVMRYGPCPREILGVAFGMAAGGRRG
jgi:hypothetical protein